MVSKRRTPRWTPRSPRFGHDGPERAYRIWVTRASHPTTCQQPNRCCDPLPQLPRARLCACPRGRQETRKTGRLVDCESEWLNRCSFSGGCIHGAGLARYRERRSRWVGGRGGCLGGAVSTPRSVAATKRCFGAARGDEESLIADEAMRRIDTILGDSLVAWSGLRERAVNPQS
jgi:hypothetical protein